MAAVVGVLSELFRVRTIAGLVEFTAQHTARLDARTDQRLDMIVAYAHDRNDAPAADDIGYRRQRWRDARHTGDPARTAGLPADAANRPDAGARPQNNASDAPATLVDLSGYRPLALACDVLDAPTWQAALQLPAEYSDVEQDQLDAGLSAIDAATRANGDDDTAARARRHRDVLARARMEDIDAAVRHAEAYPDLREPKDHAAWLAVLRRLASAQAPEVFELLARYPALLSDDADTLLRDTSVAMARRGELVPALLSEELRLQLDRVRRLGPTVLEQPLSGSGDAVRRLVTIAHEAMARYRRSGGARALDEAASALLHAFRLAATALSTGDGIGDGLSPLLRQIGEVLVCRYQPAGERTDLELALEVYDAAVKLAPEVTSIPARSALLSGFVDALTIWVDATGERAAVARIVALGEQLVRLLDQPTAQRAAALVRLADGLLANYDDEPAPGLIDRIIRLSREALTLPAEPNTRQAAEAQLLVALLRRYRDTGRDDGLDEAIEAARAALCVPSPDQDTAGRAWSVGVALRDAATMRRRPRLADAAIDLLDVAMERPSPPPALLDDLATALLRRHEETDNHIDLDRARRLAEDASRSVDRNDARAGAVHLTLGRVRRRQYSRSQDRADLDGAIAAFEESSALIDGPDRVVALANLGYTLNDRFQNYRVPDDLDRAVTVLEEVRAHTPADRPEWINRTGGLAGVLRLRARQVALDPNASPTDLHRCGADLDRAIALLDEALHGASENGLGVPQARSTLALALRDRYQRTNDRQDIERAEQVIRAALRSAPNLPQLAMNYLIVLAARKVADAIATGGDPIKADRISDATRVRLIQRLRQGDDVDTVLDELDARWADEDPDGAPTASADDEPAWIPDSLQLLRREPAPAIDVPQELFALTSRLEEQRSRARAGVSVDLAALADTWWTLLGHPSFTRIADSGRRWLLLEAANTLYVAYGMAPRLDTLDQVVTVYERLLKLLPPEHPWYPVVLVDAARFRATRHLHSSDSNDLDAAFDLLLGFVQSLQTDRPSWLEGLAYLGSLMENYPDRPRRPESFAARVDRLDTLFRRLPPNHDGPQWAPLRLALVRAYHIVGADPAARFAALHRAAEIAEEMAWHADQDGAADLAASARDMAAKIRSRVESEQAAGLQRIEASLTELLVLPGDDLDPAGIAQRLAKLRMAARQIRPQDDLATWFRVRGALLIALQNCVIDERADALDEAIGVAHDLLERAREHDAAEMITVAYTALVELYLERVLGDPADNIEQALRYGRALVEWAPIGSATWIKAHTQLAYAFTRRISGDHRANLEKALECCDQARAATSRNADPRGWASIQYMTGTVYAQRVDGVRADNLELAIEAHEAALGVLTQADDRDLWANAHHNAAIAYANRIHGDRENNLRQAIGHYDAELRFFTEQRWPYDWALAQFGLGNAYSQSSIPNPQETMDRAVAAFNAALKVLTRENSPMLWAQVRNSLGLVLIDADGIGGRALEPDQALDNFTVALEALGSGQQTPHAAQLHMNLVRPLIMIAARHPADPGTASRHLGDALEHARKGAAGLSRDTHPVEWARAQINVTACLSAYRRLGLDAPERPPLRTLEAALEVFRAGTLLSETRDAATALVVEYNSVRDWDRAVAAYRIGAEAAETLYQASLPRGFRDSAVRKARPLLEAGVTALINAGDPDGAVVAVERARARWLGEALARDRADLARLRQQHPDVVSAYEAAASRLRSVESAERGAVTASAGREPADRPAAEQVFAARAALSTAIERIRRRVGYEQFLVLPDINHVGAAIEPGVPLVYLMPTDDACLRLLLHRQPHGEPIVEAEWVREMTTEGIDQILFARQRTGTSPHPVDPAMHRALRDAVPAPAPYLTKQLTGGRDLGPALRGVLDVLGARLTGPLANRLRDLGATGVVIIPGGRLALLPLHAAAYRHDGELHCLLDEFDVRYAPSAWADAGARAAASARADPDRVLAGVGDPTGDLTYSDAELRDIEALFTPGSAHTAYGSAATKRVLLSQLPGAGYVHLACHGRYDLADPLDSHLRLADGDSLTLRELLDGQAFRDARLVVASACQTALTEFARLPDESMGFPAGLLRAGAAAVIGTLWPVDDLSTALLMVRFYELHLGLAAATGTSESMPVARALRTAQRWLAGVTARELARFIAGHDALRRSATMAAADAISPESRDPDDRPFSDPRYWAPFVLTGA